MTKLWGLHFESMDEVAASASEADAHKHADLMNVYFKKCQAENENYPAGLVVAIEWPSTPEEHARCLKEQQESK
jgi:hypothetical protein